MTLVIRPARPGDAPEAALLLEAAYAPWRARLADLPDVASGVDTEIARGPAWIAEADGRLAGIAIAEARDGIMHLANLAVAPDAGGRGIGSALVRAVEAATARRGISKMRLATHALMEGNVDFYERLGWRETGRDGNKVLMARHLPSADEGG